jgi:hypothetical protein
MTKQAIAAAALAVTMGLSTFAVPSVVHAGSIFNPFSWFSSDRDDDYYYRDHWYGPYGWGGPYGAYGPWGYAGGYPRPQTTTVVVLPRSSSDDSDQMASAHLPE